MQLVRASEDCTFPRPIVLHPRILPFDGPSELPTCSTCGAEYRIAAVLAGCIVASQQQTSGSGAPFFFPCPGVELLRPRISARKPTVRQASLHKVKQAVKSVDFGEFIVYFTSMRLQLFVILAGTPSFLLAQPSVSYVVDTAREVGVSALTAADPRFDTVLNAVLQNPRSRLPRIEAVKPYMLIVKNDSQNTIARIAIRHELSYPDRSPIVWMQALGVGQPDGIPLLEPGGSLLAFQGVQSVAPGAAGARQEEIDHLESLLRRATTVVVSLDAVIFESGLLLGPDQNGISVLYQTEQQAVKDMLLELQQLKLGGRGSQAAKEYLDRLAARTPRRTLPVPDASRDRAFNYEWKQKGLASWLLARGADLDSAIAYLSSANSKIRDLHREITPVQRSSKP